MAFAFLTFGLIKVRLASFIQPIFVFQKEVCFKPVSSMYFYGYIVYFLLWPVLYQILLRTLPRKPKAKVEKDDSEKKSE